jgi:tetrachlorobenzoquinone reductase
MASGSALRLVRVEAIRRESDVVKSLCFRPADDTPVPSFEAGAHVDLHLKNGLVRSYSLVNAGSDCYQVAVALDPNSRGGSRHIHEELEVGDVLSVSDPHNNFPLAPASISGAPSILIAGGIGITPIYAMIKALRAKQRPWILHYFGRSRSLLAFTDELGEMGRAQPGAVNISCDDERNGALPDIKTIVEHAPRDAHLYCCGPVPMLSAFSSLTGKWSRDQIHIEYFSAPEGPDTAGGFDVVLARTNRVVKIPRGKTILDALLDEGIDVPCSCMEGHCGTCETKVISGVPNHRDVFLSKDEQARNDRIMICVSGSRGDQLVLDL